jgi:hypothetical protein
VRLENERLQKRIDVLQPPRKTGKGATQHRPFDMKLQKTLRKQKEMRAVAKKTTFMNDENSNATNVVVDGGSGGQEQEEHARK